MAMLRFIVGLAFGAWISIAGFGMSAHAQVRFNTAGAGAKDTDIEAAIGLICPAGKVTHGKDGKLSGCGTCPKGTDFFGRGQSEWEVYAATPGHFTSPKDDNLLIDGQGCDADANENGGTFEFAVNAGKAKLIRYEKGLISDECIKFAYLDGRDGLVCRDGSYLQGEGVARVFVASFEVTGKSAIETLVRASDTTGTCGDDGTQLVRRWDITDIQFMRKTGSEMATGQSAQITGLAIQERIGDEHCSQIATERKTKAAPSSVKTYSVKFAFDGRLFKIDPASKVAVHELPD
jgi:hypothetical protein